MRPSDEVRVPAEGDEFGSGFTDDATETPVGDSIPTAQEALAGTSLFDFDPADGDSSDDYDLNRDGVVDHHDARAALHSAHTFHIEPPPDPHDTHDPPGLHESSDVHAPHDVHDPHHLDPADHHLDIGFFHH